MSTTTTNSTAKFIIRDARPGDCKAIYQMIYDLAVYEKMPEKVDITPEILCIDAFGKGHPPRFHALVVQRLDEEGNAAETVGYSIYNDVYSSFQGRHLWIEDIFVAEAYRQYGLASGIMRKLATFAERENMNRIEWNVLGWNKLAIGFYDSIGAINVTTGKDGLNLFRMTEEKYKEYLEQPLSIPCTITIQ